VIKQKHTVRIVAAIFFVLPHILLATTPPTVLTLDDAIYLALRNNVDLQSAELDRINQKYSLVIAKHQFEPQYKLGAAVSGNYNKENLGDADIVPTTSINAGPTASVSIANTYGTTISLSNSGSLYSQSTGQAGEFNPSLTFSVTQPLIRGFGRDIVEMDLRNALDSEISNKLQFKEKVITTINTIISDYFAVYQNMETLKINQETLKGNQTTLENDKLLVAAGRKARSELTADESAISQTELSIQDNLESIRTSLFKLKVTDLGLDPSANIQISDDINFDKIIAKLTGNKPIPDKNTARQLTLANDVGYITSVITYNGTTQRALLKAKNDALWDLSLSAGGTVGANSNNDNYYIDNNQLMINNTSSSANFSLNLDIPVDDLAAKQAILNAKIALQQGKLALEQQKRQLESDSDDRLFILQSTKDKLKMSIDGLVIEQQNVDNLQYKMQAGLITNYDFLNEKKTLTSQQQQVVSNKIEYINKLVDLNYRLGTTLDRWGIKLRY
jgi:outer membrane protein